VNNIGQRQRRSAWPCSSQRSRPWRDLTAQSTDDGRFRVDISIEDTSVYSEEQTAEGVAKMSDIPSFRTFQTSNTVILKDGQSSEFTAAADRITGEVTRIDITVTVVK
jgi:hypothetical protein